MGKSKYKRGLGAKLMNYLSQKPLSNFVNKVCNNQDLTIQIRDDYFNVYYLGGNVAKVMSPNSVDVDLNYFRKRRILKKTLLMRLMRKKKGMKSKVCLKLASMTNTFLRLRPQ